MSQIVRPRFHFSDRRECLARGYSAMAAILIVKHRL